MLKKKNRLKSNSSFKATYFQNKIASDEFFVLYAGKNKKNNEIPTKIGFVVAKKINKRAVIRNKIKRRLREASALYLKENSLPCMSYVFKAKENSQKADFNIVLKSVNNLFNKIAKKFI